MPITPELLNWLDLHASELIVHLSDCRVMTREQLFRYAESCDLVDVHLEINLVNLEWEGDNPDSPNESGCLCISSLTEPNSAIQIDERPLTFDEYMQIGTSLELVKGYLGSNRRDSYKLLDGCLQMFGLAVVVRRAPRELWEDALEQVYGSRPSDLSR